MRRWRRYRACDLVPALLGYRPVDWPDVATLIEGPADVKVIVHNHSAKALTVRVTGAGDAITLEVAEGGDAWNDAGTDR